MSYEEELQKRIESNPLMDSNDLDVKSYQSVFRALKQSPAVKLSNNFEDRVIKIIGEKRRKDSSRDIFWLGFGIFLTLIAFVVAIAMTGFNLNFGFLKAMADYKGLLIFGVVFIGVLNWLDKKLLRDKTQSV